MLAPGTVTVSDPSRFFSITQEHHAKVCPELFSLLCRTGCVLNRPADWGPKLFAAYPSGIVAVSPDQPSQCVAIVPLAAWMPLSQMGPMHTYVLEAAANAFALPLIAEWMNQFELLRNRAAVLGALAPGVWCSPHVPVTRRSVDSRRARLAGKGARVHLPRFVRDVEW